MVFFYILVVGPACPIGIQWHLKPLFIYFLVNILYITFFICTMLWTNLLRSLQYTSYPTSIYLISVLSGLVIRTKVNKLPMVWSERLYLFAIWINSSRMTVGGSSLSLAHTSGKCMNQTHLTVVVVKTDSNIFVCWCQCAHQFTLFPSIVENPFVPL